MTAACPIPSPEPNTTAPGERHLWLVLSVAVSTQAAGSLVSQGVYTLVPFWREAFALTHGQAALAVTVMNAGQILSMFALGRAIDRHGERSVVGLAMLAMGGCAFGAALAPGFPALLAWLAALGMVYASVQPGGTRAIMRWFPPEKRGLATGFRQAAVPLGTALAALLLPWLAARHGWPAALWAQGAIGIAGAAGFYGLYRDGRERGAAPPAAAIPVRALACGLLATPGFPALLAAGVAMSAFQFTFTAHALSFLDSQFGLGLVAAAWLFSIVQIVGIPGRVILPWLSDRLLPGRRLRLLAWVMLASAAATGLLAALPAGAPMPVLLVALAGLGLFGIGWFPLYVLQMAEMAPPSAIAATVSAGTTLCMLAMALAPPLFGVAVDVLGYGAAWTLLAAPIVLAAAGLLRQRHGAAPA
ncbi:MAG TPA: MFS transporter [Salinarimonas sp.]|nr:MFS transporter [Salinarimonas sp.]